MREVQQLSAEARNQTGKGPAFRARQKGLIPGIVYGGSDKPESVAVDNRILERHVETGHFSPHCSCWTWPVRRPA